MQKLPESAENIELIDDKVSKSSLNHVNGDFLNQLTDGLSHIAATSAYRSAIESNAKIFYGKTVLDIRGGTGK